MRQDGFEHPTTCQQLKGGVQDQSSTQEVHWNGIKYVCYPDETKWNKLIDRIYRRIHKCIQDGMHRKATVWYTAYKPGL